MGTGIYFVFDVEMYKYFLGKNTTLYAAEE